jgi:acyl-coenzyme A thioesterase PaaI-like protein
MDLTTVPFSQLIGLQTCHDGSSTMVSLTADDRHHNHVGTVHAAVLFSVAEAASAQAMLDSFPDLSGASVALLRTASVKYHRAGRTRLEGFASIDADAAARFRSRIERKGAASLEVVAGVREQNEELISGRFCWFVKR